MKKKFNIMLIIMSVMLIVSACSAPKKVKTTTTKKLAADDTVTEFMEATKKYDIETMISKINPENRDNMDEISKLYEQGKKEENRYLLDYLKGNAEKITYEINDTVVDNGYALVNIDVNYVDGAPLFKAVIAEYMKSALSSAFTGNKLNQEQSIKLIIDSMKKQRELVEEPMISKNMDIKCINIDNKWYITEVTDDLSNVVTSNLLSSVKKLEKTFNSNFGKTTAK